MKGASRGLEGGLRRASRGLQGGLRRASRGLEKGFKGGFKGASSPSHLRAPPGKGPFKPPLKGTFEGGGSDPAPPKLLQNPCIFFPSNAFMASARSFNTFNCMLQIRVNLLINAYTWPSAD